MRGGRAAGSGERRAPTGVPELVLTNGQVLTMEPGRPVAQAVAIRDGRIVAVGSSDEADAWVGAKTRLRDLGGATLIPGLYDSHNHLLATGLNLSAFDLSDTQCIADVLRAVADRAAMTPRGEWLLSSSRWHEAQLTEGRFPRREELDAAAPDHPLLIRRGGHNVVTNSAGLRLAGIDRDTEDPPGGTFVRDPVSGEPTGHVIGLPAFSRLLRLLTPITHQDRLDALRAILARYRAVGLTSVIEPGLQPEEMEAFRALRASGELTTRVSMMWRLEPGTTAETLAQALEQLQRPELVPELDDQWLRLIGIKLVADGGVETGYHRQPYAFTDDPTSPRGKPRMSLETIKAFGQAAASRGWMVGTHCVGDAAIDLVLEGYAAVNAVTPIRDLRWTLIHMMCAREEHWEQVNALGLAVTAQQPLLYSLAAGFWKYLGPERTRNVEPLRMYLERCLQPVGGGSDSPVTPYDPLIGIYSSATRLTELAGLQGPEWRIGAEQALRMYTSGSAWCAGEERVKGAIRPGAYADLVVLSADPRTVEPEGLREIRVLATIVDGEVVFDRETDSGGPPLPRAAIDPAEVESRAVDGGAARHHRA